MVRKLILLTTMVLLILGLTIGSNSTSEITWEQSSTTITPTEMIFSEISVYSPPKNVCLEVKDLDQTWPVAVAVRDWNRQFIAQLRIDSDDCYAVVPVELKSIPGKWGETNNNRGKWSVFVSPAVPWMWRRHVLCHEFGHLLGLDHTSEVDSCMNIQLTHPTPSTANLQEAGKNLWMFSR